MGRLVRSVSLGVIFALSLSVQAFAKDSKDDHGKGKKDAQQHIQKTGIEVFDSVFSQVDDIDHTLSSIEGQLRDGKNNLNSALALQKGTPLADGLAELKNRAGNKVSLAMDKGTVPKLEANDALPSNVRNAVDAVNQMTSNFGVSIDQLTGLAPDMEKLVKQTGKMPGRLVEEFKKGGNGGLFDRLFKLPKIAKALKGDLAVTAGLPDRAQGIQDRMNDIMGTVESSFGNGPVHHPSGGGNAGGGNAGKGNAGKGNAGKGNAGKGKDKGKRS
jgi:hypothetical protein